MRGFGREELRGRFETEPLTEIRNAKDACGILRVGFYSRGLGLLVQRAEGQVGGHGLGLGVADGGGEGFAVFGGVEEALHQVEDGHGLWPLARISRPLLIA